MKKLIYGAAIALLIGAASCGKTDDASGAPKFFSQQATDSLTVALAQVMGTDYNIRLAEQMRTDSTISKTEILRGLQFAMQVDTATSFEYGFSIGSQALAYIKQMNKLGIKVNKDMLMSELTKAIFAEPTPDRAQLDFIAAEYRVWDDSLRRAYTNHLNSERAASPEAKENLEKGINYVKAQAAMHSDSVQITPSGLGVKIVNPGKGEKVDISQPVKIKYTVTSPTDGRRIDGGNGIMNLSSRPKGLQEGISMLGKGGKAVLYVPGNLAYGVDVPRGVNLGLNEAVVIEVEVSDVPDNPTPAPSVPSKR